MKNKNLHIIIYSSFPKYSGGRENWLYNILPYIKDHFDKIYIYVYQSKQIPFYNINNLKGIHLKEITTLRSYGYVFMVINRLLLQTLFLIDIFYIFRVKVKSELLREIKDYDTILAMNSITETLPAIDLKRAGHNIYLVSSVRGIVPQEFAARIPILRNLFSKVEKKCLRQCDKVLANGYDTQSYLKKIGITSEVVPNGVDMKGFQKRQNQEDEDLNKLSNMKNNGLRIIMMVATLRKIKGIDYVLDAGMLLKTQGFSDFVIVFVGKGNQINYKQKAKELGIQDKVEFIGEKKNISSYLNVADIVLCVSGGGGMSMSTLEAMAIGKPIVAWDTPVYQQLITHMKDGYLVKYSDNLLLAAAIIELLENPEMCNEFSQNARRQAAQYDWPIVASKLMNYL